MQNLLREEVTFERTVEHILLKIKELKAKGYNENEIIEWVEGPLDKEISLVNTFEDIGELCERLELDIKRMNIFWM